MMKRTLILAAVMVFACAAMANAWVITMSWKSPVGTMYNNNPTVGNPANSLLTHPPAQEGTLQAAILTDAGMYYRYYQTDVAPDTQWTILFWGNNYTTAEVGRLRVWIPQTPELDMREWQLTDLATGDVVWSGVPDVAKKTEADPWFEVFLPVVNTSTPLENATRYSFAPVPEPGSIVALCSGLIGLAGFGIRRRK